MVFDKTGTLTQGKFGVSKVIPFQDTDSDEILKYAASLESYSEHPIARGVAAAARNHLSVEEFKALPGKGVEGYIDGHKVEVVSPGYLQEMGLSFDQERLAPHMEKTAVFVVLDGRVEAALLMSDLIRPESRQAISALKEMGIKTIMITGDRREVAEWVAEELSLDQYFSQVLPGEKAEKIRKIQEEGLVVAMTGDGINDAPALAQADVGIAIGAGTDVAIETADIILVRNNPLDTVYIIRLARSTYRKMVENLAWGAGYNILAIPLAAGVLYAYGILLTPAMGAVLMSVSTIIVAVNSRFLRIGK